MIKQKWKDVFFAHWPISAKELKPHIPNRLEIDTFDGTAWISVVLFLLDGIYIKGLPIRVVRPFPEINVRTYVTYRGMPGVYFMSLDASHWMTYTVARQLYRLAYRKADVQFERGKESFYFKSERITNQRESVRFCGSFTPDVGTYIAEPGTLAYFLTERYRFYSGDAKENIFCGEVKHAPWQLQHTSLKMNENELFRPFRLDLGERPALLQYSPGVAASFDMIKQID